MRPDLRSTASLPSPFRPGRWRRHPSVSSSRFLFYALFGAYTPTFNLPQPATPSVRRARAPSAVTARHLAENPRLHPGDRRRPCGGLRMNRADFALYDDRPLGGEQLAVDPALESIMEPDPPPIVELGDDLDGQASSPVNPFYRILISRTGAHVDF